MKRCAIQDRMVEDVCEGDNRITLQGGNNNCDIVLKNVRKEDFGVWECAVTDIQNLSNGKNKIALEVGSPATVQFQKSYGIDNTLVVTEGETVKVRLFQS